MNYQETIDWLFTQTTVFQRDGASAYKPGLQTIRDLCAAFVNPQDGLKCIHIAGTNGKGSTAHTLAAILQSAGLKTGLYTSPHLTDFRERIKVDGEMIPREAVTGFIEQYLEMGLDMQPSFFELTTAMAFKWFAEQNIDIAVIETGLGGRLDSTNIITPLVSVITNISLDHTSLLGDTIEEIAGEKAGIIKPGVPVVIGEPGEVGHVFERKAEELNSPISFAQPLEAVKASEGGWDYPAEGLHGELSGDFQPKNAATVLEVLRVLNLPEVDHEAIAKGFANVEELTGLRGRLTTLQTNPFRVIYDTGHNPGAWEYLGKELGKIPSLNVVIGFAADKDVDTILKKMPKDARYYFCRPSGNRGMDAGELRERAFKQGLRGDAYNSVAEAVKAAYKDAAEGCTVFVGGSNFVVADFLQALEAD